MEGTELDWKKVEEYLARVEKAYTFIGTPGYFCLTYVIRPCRDRFNNGERTEQLYHEIMEIKL